LAMPSYAIQTMSLEKNKQKKRGLSIRK